MFVTLLSATETVALIRDIAVIVFLSLTLLVVLIATVLGVALYRRSSRIIGRVEHTFDKVEDAAEATRAAASAVRKGLTSGFGVTGVLRSVAGAFGGRRDRDRRS